MNIQKLPDKYINNGWVSIPVAETTQMYGRPLYKFEFIPGRKGGVEKGKIFFEKLILGLPNFEKVGYTSWREVDCSFPTFELMDTFGLKGDWGLLSYCPEHRAPVVEIYAPLGATTLNIELFSGVMCKLKWK